MTTAEQHTTAYLARLESLTADLPPEVRADLLADVRAHLDEAQAVATTGAEFRQALDRLGTPEAVAAEARGTHAPDGPGPGGPGRSSGPDTTRSGPRRSDSVALGLMLVFTALALPLLGLFALLIWIAGATMLWASPSWTTGEKTLGTLVWPGGLSFPLLLGLVAGPGTAVAPPWAGIPLLVVLVGAPIAVAIMLLRRANTRAGEPARTV